MIVSLADGLKHNSAMMEKSAKRFGKGHLKNGETLQSFWAGNSELIKIQI